jgi:hypothetical protein
MKSVAFVILLVITQNSFSQNRIFVRSTDINDQPDSNIKKIELPFGDWGSTVKVIYRNGDKSTLKRNLIWGFQIAGEKEIKRIYKGQIFDVVDTSIIVIYKTYSRHAAYYFSSNLDSPLEYLDKKKLVEAIGREKYDEAFQKSPLLQHVIEIQ